MIGAIQIVEDYLEFHGAVYYAWRKVDEKDWHFKKMGVTQKPYVTFRYVNEVELAEMESESLAKKEKKTTQMSKFNDKYKED